MPTNKSVNLTKLKSSAKKASDQDACKKTQVTISKFFASKTPNKGDDDVEIIVDTSTKISESIKEKRISSPFKKRSREYDVDNQANGSTSKRICFESIETSNSTNQFQQLSNVKPVKRKSVSPNKPTSSKDDHAGMNQICVSLSASTLNKLKQFQNHEDKSDTKQAKPIDLETLKRSKHIIDIDSFDDEKKRFDHDKSMDVDFQKEESAAPSTSASSQKATTILKKFSSESNSNIKKTKSTKYTPLEQQYIEIKEKYSDCVLFVECGYKYRFFGEDAEIAAKVLKIYCHEDHNFMTASIPTHRLFVHVRRLVSAGYKVGVVKQMETAALKAASDNRSAPFTRKLSAIYTKSTLIGEDVDPLSGIEESTGETTSSAYSSYLMCMFEESEEKADRKHSIGLLAVQPATGDVIYDCFDDNIMRSELETRISHIQPVEMITPHSLTETTDRLIKDIVSLSVTDDDRIRVDKIEDKHFEYNHAFNVVSDFYTKENSSADEQVLLQEIVNLPRPVIRCLAAVIVYLKDFNLDKVLKLTCNFSQFSTKSKYMQLSGNTIRNLEIFNNQTDGLEKGSLFSLFNQTVTKYGGRLLRSWLIQPLLSVSEIRQRQNAVTELIDGQCSDNVNKLRGILAKTPDLEKGLCSIYHKKCSTHEFYCVGKSLTSISQEFKIHSEAVADHLTSDLLKTILTNVPELLEDVSIFSDKLNEKAARENDKTVLFNDDSQFPDIIKCKKQISEVMEELQSHRREIRLQLKQPSLDYVTVLGTEFLVEVKNSQLNLVPNNWQKISSTKVLSRFHTPFIVEKYKVLNQLREQLVIDSNQAWMTFLDWFGGNYQRYKKAVHHLATLDCLFSLAETAKHNGYCKPEILDTEVVIDIDKGRHPVIDQLLDEQNQFVPNDTKLSGSEERVMIITGPNMGGKSSYIKQVALLAVLAQIGSYVPAQSARLGIFDAIHTRMGAADEIYKGRSTFMVELQEASEIISGATSRSLVILDELGRGTSTHDGVAIACATLNYFIKETKCLTLFVTHYPMLSEFEKAFPGIVGNYHMSFLLNEDSDEDGSSMTEVITFLYQLVSGSAARSYGLNVAHLADIPNSILDVATAKSHSLERIVTDRRKQIQLFQSVCGDDSEDTETILNHLKAVLSSNMETNG